MSQKHDDIKQIRPTKEMNKRKLYIFATQESSLGVSVVAMSDSGKILAGHLCSNMTYAYGDLVGRRPERTEMYKQEFDGKEGEAFEVLVLPVGTLPPEEVLDKHTELGEAAVDESNMPKIKITLSE